AYLPCGQKDRLYIPVDGLPVDVPISDPDQPLLCAVGKPRKSLKVFTQIVSVWVNSQDVHVDRQLEFVCYGEVLASGWNVERPVSLELRYNWKSTRRLCGTIKSEPRHNC